MKHFIVSFGLIACAVLAPGVLHATSIWGNIPLVAETHFHHAWLSHQDCGRPLDVEHREGKRWVQQFENCTMWEEPVHVMYLHGTPPASLTPAPRATTTPTATPRPYSTAPPSYTAACSAGRQCALYTLGLINAERAGHGAASLTFDPIESHGQGSCIGAQGHATHMARTDVVGHDQFPQDICGRFVAAGENVGVAYGATRNAIDAIQRMMLAEPWSRGCAGNHHCTEDNPAFKSVGIGLARAGHFVFLSEDLKG